MLHSAAFASSVVASMPTVLPSTRPPSARRCSIAMARSASKPSKFPQALDESVEAVLVENLIQSRIERMGGTAGRSSVATHIDVCFACCRRLPIAIGDSVVRGIGRVDPIKVFRWGCWI